MKSMHELENKIEGWLKPFPHLPSAFIKWLANNIWWLVLLGVIGSLISIIVLLSKIYVMIYIAQVYYGWWMSTAVISLLFTVVLTAIMMIAISPLRSLAKKGWEMLFLSFVVGIAAKIVNILIIFNIFNFISNLIFIAIGAVIGTYFLFEIRSHFNVIASITKK